MEVQSPVGSGAGGSFHLSPAPLEVVNGAARPPRLSFRRSIRERCNGGPRGRKGAAGAAARWTPAATVKRRLLSPPIRPWQKLRLPADSWPVGVNHVDC